MNIVQRLKYAAQAFGGRLPVNNGGMREVGAQLVSNLQNTNQYVKNGYSANAIVYAIISYSARKFSTVPLHLYEKTNDAAFKRYKVLLGSGFPTTKAAAIEATKLRRKALKAVDTHPVLDLLARPNPMQGGSSFIENLYGFKLITGAGTAWANRGGIEGGEPLELWCLPSQDIDIVCKRPDFLVPVGYQLKHGYITNLRKEDVLYWKYWNPNWSTDGSHLYGMAPLQAGAMVATERSKADRASATVMQNLGSKGVMFAKGEKGMSVEQRDQLQDRLDQEVNGIQNLGRVGLANTELGYINLGQTMQEMAMEGVKRMSKEDLCNVFGFPPVILDPSKGTLANLEASIKSFVTNKIIPEWCSLRDDLNAWLLPMYKDGRRYWLEPDFSAIPELQEDLEKQVNAVMKIWPLTPNQMLEYLGWEIDETDPVMNRRYAPANLVPLDELSAPADDISTDVEKLLRNGISDYK
ncbi:phage portal protein [Chitinophaga rhizosphaerae]|uniref:phage portal protein n=1 Tax=Chitinophaga rhizosphaerae TaxID=1864947 RepID=UPI000F802C30|nr:phage portal protein [Chitinophaga rhizosphaerae]